jgi:uncharacterized RDD family membrane protein YckC
MADDLYRTPQAVLIEPLIAQPLTLAPRGTRLAAAIVDQLLVFPAVLPMIVGFAVSESGESSFSPLSPASAPWLALSVLMVIGLAVADLVLMARHGQTFAKRWLGIRVVRSDGSRLSLGRYICLRLIPVNLLAQVPFVGIVVALADPLLIFRDNTKCLHDEIADTIVVMA